MKEKNKLIIAIVAVVGIIVLVGGATFAYWTWITSEEQQTSVSFQVDESVLQGQLNANLIGGGATRISKLAPVTSCDKGSVIELTLTYKNATTNPARVNGTLWISNFNTPHGVPSTDNLSHLHYALTTSETSCTTGAIEGATGVFKNTSDGHLFADVLMLNNIPANMTEEGEQKYYLWMWLDSEYTPEVPNEGNTINDPMQNMNFTLSWTGTIANDVEA